MSFIRTLVLLSVMLWIFIPAKAQYNPEHIPKRARKWYTEALQKANIPTEKSKGETLSLLKKAIAKAPDYFDAYTLIGHIYARNHDYQQAVKSFEKANTIDSAHLLPDYDVYARVVAGTGDFSLALQLIDQYLEKNTLSKYAQKVALDWKAHYIFGLKSKQQHLPFNPVNLGDSINSKDAEYSPDLTIDGKKLIFTRKVNGIHEEFFISQKIGDQWNNAVPLRTISLGDKMRSYNIGSGTISRDGKALLLTICDSRDGMGSCDIYFAVRQSKGWSEPRNMGPPVNSHFWDSQPCLSPDGKDLYFVSNRPGGYGGSDIYVCHWQADGKWGTPENIGDSINTSGNESSPFIHADNTTLYFASDGHPGVGGVDLFYVRKRPDGSWHKPHNLGYPINTIDHDGSIYVAADGKTAYFASDRKDSRGALDLYKFTLYPTARPIKTLYVQGQVFDKKTGKTVSASIDLTDIHSGHKIATISTGNDGAYLVTLPVGKDYAFNVNKPGFLFYSDHFALADSVKWQPFELNILLQPIEKDKHIILKNVFFDLDKYTLRSESYMELNNVVKLLGKNPGLSIQINGYTDSLGTEEHNILLSQKRAQAVVDYLVSMGIERMRMQAKGFGAARPIASNTTEEERAENRRTELEVISDKK